MKCFITKLTGSDIFKNNSSEMCVPFSPIISALIASVAFVALTTVVSHLIR